MSHIPYRSSMFDRQNSFLNEVAFGNIPGAKVYHIPGAKTSLSSTVFDDISEIPATTVIPNPGGIQLELVSSLAADDIAGTGIQKVEIHYLDTSNAEQNETVEMSGVAPKTTIATDINKIQWIHAKQVGSGGVAAGNITLRTTGGGGSDFSYIKAGGNQSLSAIYHIPAGKTGYILGWNASGIIKIINFSLRATMERFDQALLPGIFLFQDVLSLSDSVSGWIKFESPIKVPALATVKISGISSAAGGDGGASFEILILDEVE